MKERDQKTPQQRVAQGKQEKRKKHNFLNNFLKNLTVILKNLTEIRR